MKDIYSIIESNAINEKEKEIKLKEIFIELTKKDKDELRSIFNVDAYNLFLSFMNVSTTGINKILLDIIELLSEKGIKQQYNNQFFDSFQQSGLITKIEQLIKDKIKIEKKQKKYSEETQQLTRICIKIMKERESDQSMIDIYYKVINININNLLETVNILKQSNNETNNNQINKEEIESELKQSSKLVRIISLIGEKDPNSKYETRIPDQIKKILNEKLSPLIHINCPEFINCTQRIVIQTSPALQELKEAVFQALIQASNNNSEFRNILDQDNNFLPHLAPFIISYSTQYQLQQKTKINQQQHQQQSKYSSSPSFISSSLSFLSSLIFNNKLNNNNNKYIIYFPKLLHSLTILFNYQLNIHINNEQDQQSQEIRNES